MKQVPTDDPQILGSTEQNLFAMATLRPGLVAHTELHNFGCKLLQNA